MAKTMASRGRLGIVILTLLSAFSMFRMVSVSLSSSFFRFDDVVDNDVPVQSTDIGLQALVPYNITTTGEAKNNTVVLASNGGGGDVNSTGTIQQAASDTNKEHDDEHYCAHEGSLHQLAMNMIQHSSPKGSPSYHKLRHVLSQNSVFKVELLPKSLFESLENNMAELAEGWGLQPASAVNQSNVTVFQEIMGVGTSWSSICDLHDPACHDNTGRAFVILQSEQLYASPAPELNRTIHKCHALKSCILLDFSSHNLQWANEHGVADSFVLLPVMTQTRSRIMPGYRKIQPVIPLANRSIDVTFFGRKSTPRRRELFRMAGDYGLPTANTTNRTVYFRDLIHDQRRGKWARNHMSESYANSKVCLVAHTFPIVSSGELHRLSEFAPFGCIPVMETFSDTIGIEQYQRCAKVHFATFENLFQVTDQVLQKIDTVSLDHLKWWSVGVRWREILPAIFIHSHLISGDTR